jgi:hypothetical protein
MGRFGRLRLALGVNKQIYSAELRGRNIHIISIEVYLGPQLKHQTNELAFENFIGRAPRPLMQAKILKQID